jgi:hypothetical protein
MPQLEEETPISEGSKRIEEIEKEPETKSESTTLPEKRLTFLKAD